MGQRPFLGALLLGMMSDGACGNSNNRCASCSEGNSEWTCVALMGQSAAPRSCGPEAGSTYSIVHPRLLEPKKAVDPGGDREA